MLEIKDLYKKQDYILLKNVNLNVAKGESVSIECSDEISKLLINLIVGRELPERGQINIDGKNNVDYAKKHLNNIGIVLKDDGLYERLTVKQYLKSYSQIIMKNTNYLEVMMKMSLMDIGDVSIKKLNQYQRRRISFARECLKQPKFLILQEPILNMDKESIRIILENIQELCDNGCTVLSTSISFKDIMLLSKDCYILDGYGIKKAQNEPDILEEDAKNIEEEMPVYKIEKIPAKIDERILLFDPIEIDYVESEQGVSNLSIRGEKFPCGLSLTELESRLIHVGFFRCHRSYLVNLQRIREVVTWTRNSFSLSLNDKVNSSIPLSKSRVTELKEIFKI